MSRSVVVSVSFLNFGFCSNLGSHVFSLSGLTEPSDAMLFRQSSSLSSTGRPGRTFFVSWCLRTVLWLVGTVKWARLGWQSCDWLEHLSGRRQNGNCAVGQNFWVGVPRMALMLSFSLVLRLYSYRNSWPRRQENLSKTCGETYKDSEMVIIDGPECLVWDEASCNRGHALWLIFFKLTQHHHTWIAHVWAVLCPSTPPGIRPRLMKEQVCDESSSRGAWHPPIWRVIHRAIAVPFQC